MKIDSSVINMTGKSEFLEVNSKQERLNFWTGDQRPVNDNTAQTQNIPSTQLDTVNISEKGKNLFLDSLLSSPSVVESEDSEHQLSDKDKQKIFLIEKLLERLTGKKFKIKIPKGIKLDNSNSNINMPQNRPQAQRNGWGLEYDYHEYHRESQKMSFSSNGTVKTADGREINFSVDLNMSREFVSSKDIRIRAGDVKQVDPLAINFDTNIPQLTDQKYSFDIDSDGTSDQISFLAQGSGFLALDLNSDGIVNNGKELFGPQSGNGFSELAKYDSDGNNWIDENDPVFDKLRIWTKEPDGTDRLFAIGEKGIGAIYLGNVKTPFEIKNSSNASLGEIQQTGIFLKESGVAGTINHIDLTV